MGANLLPEFIAECAALPKLLEEFLQHAHDDGIHADAFGFGPLPQFHPSFVTDMKQHRVATVATASAAPVAAAAPVLTMSAPPRPRLPLALDPAILGIIHDAKAKRSMDAIVGNICRAG